MRAVCVAVPADVMPEADQVFFNPLLRRSRCSEPMAWHSERRSSMHFDRNHCANNGQQPNE
jgi:hypothetical protein